MVLPFDGRLRVRGPAARLRPRRAVLSACPFNQHTPKFIEFGQQPIYSYRFSVFTNHSSHSTAVWITSGASAYLQRRRINYPCISCLRNRVKFGSQRPTTPPLPQSPSHITVTGSAFSCESHVCLRFMCC